MRMRRRSSSYYRDHGYLRANVGVPELKEVADSTDKKTRWVELKVPITEGPRYKVGSFDVAGNTVVKTDFLKPLFKMQPGEYYGEKRIRKGLEKAREIYGTGGYYEFTGFPDYKFHDDPNPNEPEAPEALKAPETPETTKAKDSAPLVDVTMRMQEGQQFFVNRLTFTGNTTTRDNVIRREMRVLEGGAVQHRSAEVQRQAAQSARLLQGARRQAGRSRRPEGAERDQQGRHQVEAGRAESQPADVRRRRVGVRGLLRTVVVPDRQLPRPRREPDAVAVGRIPRPELLAWRSASRSSSTGTSPAARTSSRPTSATSASSRRSRPARC